MDYNNYYPAQSGHPPNPMPNHQPHGLSPMQQMMPGSNMMHNSGPHQSIRQVVTPSPHGGHQPQQMHSQQQQQQQHLGHHIPMSPQQQQQHQHLNYQQLPLHPSPSSHSGSPHPQQPHSHNQHQQQNLNLQHPPRPSTGPSPHQQHPNIHQQSPHHIMSGPPMHVQQSQQLNQIGGPPILPPGVNQHNQNFMGPSPIPPIQSPHYAPQHNQPPAQPPSQTPRPLPSMHHGLQPPYPSHVQQPIERGSPYHHTISPTEFRIIELNKRLQNRPPGSSVHPISYPPYSDQSYWWEKFACDFFDDDSTLTLTIPDMKPSMQEYTIGRTLIPRFFRSYFDGGVTDLSIKLRSTRETTHHNMITLDCDHADITTKNVFKHRANNMAMNVIVHAEGKLSLDFVSNSFDSLLIKAWRFNTMNCHEYIDRSMTNSGLPHAFLVEPVTKQGLTNSTMTFLKTCMIMEPMQDLMFLHRQSKMDPKTCLRQLLYDKYKYKSVEDNRAQPKSKRRRKTPAAAGTTGTNKKSKANANNANPMNNNNNIGFNNNLMSPSTVGGGLPSLSLASQDVMVVGEPSSMGADYHDENERSITKIENSNYVSALEIPSSNTDRLQPSPDQAIQEEVATSATAVMVAAATTSNERVAEEEVVEEDREEVKTSVVVEELELKEKEDPDTQKSDTVHFEEATTSAQQDSTQQQSHQSQSEVKTEPVEDNISNAVVEESTQAPADEPPRQTSEEPLEKENNGFVLNDGSHTNSTATQSENNLNNIMNSIPEDREDTGRSTSCDSLVSKLPPSSNNRSTLTSNGSSNKQNRRRSSERKETLREGLMRTSDFVVAMKDLKCEHPALWRITTGNNLLQQFEPKTQNGIVLYENTNQYAGWNPEIKKDYVGVDVKLTQHTRNQITVERLLLNFEKIEDAEAFYDKHFVIYLQILISTALDPKFWECIESETKHHDYFLTSRRIVEDITKRFKVKLSNKLKLGEISLKNFEKYPNLLIKSIDGDDKAQPCRACNTNPSTQIVTFGNRSYDLHSYKQVKVTSELSKTDDKDLWNNLCDSCLEIVKLYSEIHHMGWKLYNIAKEKVELHRTKGKPINAILDECLKDEEWMASIYVERDTLWSKVEQLQ